MDIYFCDECAARVTDLDLRAGKGMRRRHATICAGCVDQGLAQAWLTRVGSASATAQQGGAVERPLQAATAVVDASDPISVGRDRAMTAPDDPFQVDEPAAIQQSAQPAAARQVNDTDRLPAADAPARPPAEPMDDLASAGGGFGALMNAAMPPPPPGLVDDPADSAEAAPADGAPAAAQPDTPFDYVSPQDADNPGKAETSEVHAVDDKADAPKPASRTSSGRQAAQGSKRNATTTSKRNAAKPSSTRRTAKPAMSNKKLMIMTLVSCVVMGIVFFGFILPNVGKSKPAAPQQITEDPYVRFKEKVDVAKAACHKALTAEDIAVVRTADHALKEMVESLDYFKSVADTRGYKEENYEELLRQAGFYDVQSMRKGVKDRLFILEQRGK